MLQNKLLVTTTLRYCFTYTTRSMWKGRVPPIRPFPLMCKDDMNRGALTTTYCRASSTTRRRRKNRDPGDPAMALHECLQGLRIENFQSMYVLKTDRQGGIRGTLGRLDDWNGTLRGDLFVSVRRLLIYLKGRHSTESQGFPPKKDRWS